MFMHMFKFMFISMDMDIIGTDMNMDITMNMHMHMQTDTGGMYMDMERDIPKQSSNIWRLIFSRVNVSKFLKKEILSILSKDNIFQN